MSRPVFRRSWMNRRRYRSLMLRNAGSRSTQSAPRQLLLALETRRACLNQLAAKGVSPRSITRHPLIPVHGELQPHPQPTGPTMSAP